MKQREIQTYTCKHCGRTFTDAGLFLTHDCDAQQTSQMTAERHATAILQPTVDYQVEPDGDILWR